ncbi:MAG TPA: helix-turn-helix domain-containing protein [Desulfosporosinus sp.]|nr:helix-turn-helix domain-containing protein [Desulfosporosinus sp.]
MTNNINDSGETRIRMGKIIKEARLKMDLTQSELGKMLGKSDNVVTNWEKGTNSPDVNNIERLCAILDIPVDYIFQAKQKSPIMELKKDEQKLITLWRKLDRDDQMKILGMIEIKTEECATLERELLVKRGRGNVIFINFRRD